MSEDDDALMAELRAISNKSKSSSRFDDDGTETNGINSSPRDRISDVSTSERNIGLSFEDKAKSTLQSIQKVLRNNDNEYKSDSLSSSKPQASEQHQDRNFDRMIVESPVDTFNESSGFGLKHSSPKRFQGERGGDANDADLLAELRAISMKNSSADRFNEDNPDNPQENESLQKKQPIQKPKQKVSPKKTDISPKKDKRAPPPWKTKGIKPKETQSCPFDNFQIVADDKSMKDSTENVGMKQNMSINSTPTKEKANESTPESIEIDDEANGSSREEAVFGGFQDTTPLPKTFQGERGGNADDEDLLAELRAISMRNASANRFAGDDDDDGDEEEEEETEKQNVRVPAPVPKKPVQTVKPWQKKSNEAAKKSPSATKKGPASERAGDDLPPWKQKNRVKDATDDSSQGGDFDVVVSSPLEKNTSPKRNTESNGSSREEAVFGGFQDTTPLPKTFQGERGGNADDEDLLAELRAISMRNASANRFAGDDDGDEEEEEMTEKQNVRVSAPVPKTPVQTVKPWQKKSNEAAKKSPSATKKGPASERAGDDLPPWKQKNRVKDATDDSSQGGDFDVVVSSPRTQRNQLEPSISTKRSSGFQSDSDILDSSNHRDRNLVLDQTAPSKSSKAGVVHNIPAHSGCKEIEIALPPKTNIPTNPVEDITVTETNVGDYIYSKNWKLRKASYDVLEEILVRKMKGRNPMNDVDGREIDQCVTDSLLVEMGKDSNASALDSGLRFLFGFIDFCKKGSDPDTITPLIASIVTGPAMTSARPSTVKSVEAVLMKAMQVSKSQPSSIHIVVGMLLDHGITSRNPKVVSKSVAIMLDAARAFGVAHLPLSKVIASSDKILSHPNGEVRDYGINILAELCRSFGSKEPISDLLSRMKPAQVSELDALLSAQRGTQQPSIGLRFDNSSPQSNVLEILQAGAVADAAEKFALREPVNIFDALRETDYYQKMKEAKWSEKVNALDTLLRCGGEKPYKLTQPSSSVNYKTLISDLKKLLSHTHYAVKSKSALALAMLAEGVGSKLFSHLRPLLLTLVDLTKDKKIATSIEICLDSLFDNVIGFSHLLEEEGGLISVLDEKKQKNALIRKTALSYLNRCVKRSADAKGRGTIDFENVNHVFTLCVEKASDSDAGVRREASSLLIELLSHPDESVQRLTSSLSQDLEQTNSRVFKLLSKDIAPSSERPVTRSDLTKSPATAKKNPYVKKHPYVPSKSTHHSDPVKNKPSPPRNNKAAHSSNAAPNSSKQDLKRNVSTFHVNDINIPSVQEANSYVLALNIPNWNVDDLDGDVVSGLQSNNWKCRCAAISSLITFSDTSEAKSEGLAYAKNVFVIVRSGTKEFRDGNFNILKAACHLVLKICDLYQSLDQTMDEWICKDAVAICVQKVADKKFVDIIPDLFFRLCEVQSAGIIFLFALSEIAVKKSPVMIEGLLMLSERFCVEFGIDAIGRGLNEFVTWVSEQCGNSNIKVKNAALSLLGIMHKQSGPPLRLLVLSQVHDTQVKQHIEKQFDSSRFEPSASSYFNRKTFVAPRGDGKNDGNEPTKLAVPQIDLLSELPPNILTQLNVKDSKDSWKIRKAALEEVESSCQKYNGLVYSTVPEGLKRLTDLMKVLKLRLDDSQSNLKPIAARNIATILNSVDASSQQVLGRIVYGPLLRASMNDNKKIVRDAALEALNRGTVLNDIAGGGINGSSMESLIAGFVSELEQSEYKATGLPDVLNFFITRVQHFPTIHTVTTTKSRTILANFARILVGCLSSSKSETRAAAESLLQKCVHSSVICEKDLSRALSTLLPAEQRKVKPTISAIVGSVQKDMSQPETRRSRSSTPSGLHAPVTRNVQSSSSSRIRSSSASRSSRHSIGVGRRDVDKISIDQLIKDSSFHPLKTLSPILISKRNRVMKQRDHIPEYPEEPTSKETTMTLKKSWSTLIPSQSIEILFPSSGIDKQDDSANGCALLSHSLSLSSRDHEPDIILEQLDLILRWFNLALCSRETTSGMESLLSFFSELITFVRDENYQFNDSECASVLPYLLEKSGVAKGRFRERIRQLLDFIRDETLYPLNKYGSVVCISVIEHTSNSKTKGIAIKELISCVETNGLPAIGKKGIPVIAKGFAEENIPENKSNYLDLIQCIISRMNGDVGRFFKLCGSTILSRKDTEAIQVKVSRFKPPQVSNTAPSPKASSTVNSESPKRSSTKRDEVEGPFTFSFGSKAAVSKSPDNELYCSVDNLEQLADASSGAAASLRERLRQIRDKHSQEEGLSNNDDNLLPARPNLIISKNQLSCRLYDEIVEAVEIMLQQPTPLSDINENFTKALVGLRQMHSSLSNGKNDSTGTNPALLVELRHYLYGKVPETVDMLTRILDFGFRCGSPTNKDGLSVPLLSVSIAGLMAIFLDAKFASQISVKSLTAVIYYSTAALLDKRLSATATPESYGLDSSTSKKMVKAINKLAIQASYGAARHVSFMTLISLQVKLCTNIGKDLRSSDSKSTGQRMSRIISKLFARVIKAEETEISPFSRQDFDMPNVLKVVENSLAKCIEVCSGSSSAFIDWTSYNSSYMSPCIALIDTLVHHVLDAKNNQGKLNDLSKALADSGLGENSLTSKFFNDACLKIGISPLHSNQITSNTKLYDVDYLSELIFTVGGAQDGQERLNAMADLREYLDAHKDIDIEAHLSGVSSPFRRYILDQLKSPFRPLLTPSERSLFSGIESSSSAAQLSSQSILSEWSQSNMSMSQKLRHLKNKINAAEATANSSMSDQADNPLPNLSDEEMYQAIPEHSGPVSSLRQRLAAATERAKVRSPEPSKDVSRPSSAVGNAAALRARLESVKRMSRN